MKKIKLNSGFTLVELLAVIVILAIILVIAVPKVMSIIEDAKKGTLESTAKMIASGAEKQKVQNTILGNNKEITCDSVAKINKGDYVNCSIEFDNNTAKVTIQGSGKFDGLWVCDGTKTSATAQTEECGSGLTLQVNHPLFLKGQAITPDKFQVTATYSDGSTVKLWSGGMKVDETKEATTITSPNWPENYSDSMTEEENYWEATYEGAEAIQITFDETSETEAVDYDYIVLYDKEGNEKYRLGGTDFAGETYTITGDYVKVTMETDSNTNRKGFSATIKPAYKVPAEYTVSPSITPNTEGNFDITITLNGQNISKKITTETVHDVEDYIESLEPFETVLKNGIKQTSAEYNGTTYDAGIRYVGAMSDVNNKVYYNCDDIDTNGVAYGETNYNYASSCEVWRIIGVFDTKSSISDTNGTPRVKLINTASTFKASWDSSLQSINDGDGINQWGSSTYEDGTFYEGADLMQLLNVYYIGESSTCIYCDDENQATCEQICTVDSLKNANMKSLTSGALDMIGNAVWHTYGVRIPDDNVGDVTWASTAYLEEKGISAQLTGKLCPTSNYCNDKVERTTNWTGLVGLMSVADILYANGWLYNQTGSSLRPWSISSNAFFGAATHVSYAYDNYTSGNIAGTQYGVFASVYLKSNIKIVSGNGDTEPYILSVV